MAKKNITVKAKNKDDLELFLATLIEVAKDMGIVIIDG